MADLHVHTLVVRDHRISCCDRDMVQHGMGHDAISLDLDAEWDGLSVRVVLGSGDDAAERLWDGEPWVVPAALLAEPDWLPVSVVGYDGDGTVRVVTERCDHELKVIASGQVDGSEPIPDAPDLLGQLVEAADKATDAAGDATKAAESANAAASAATQAVGKVDAAVESAESATKAATDAAASATSAAKQASDAAERADKLAEDIPAYVTAAKQSATEAARAASDADGSATAAGKSASAAAGSAEKAAGSATAAQGSANAASGSAQQAATSAGEAASSATAAGGSATEAASSATKAAQSAAQVADKYITAATATTLEPGEQATAQVVEQVLQLGIPQGEPGETPDTSDFLKLTHPNDTTVEWLMKPVGNNNISVAATAQNNIPKFIVINRSYNKSVYIGVGSGQAIVNMNGKSIVGFVDSFTDSSRGDMLPTVLCLRNTLMDYVTTEALTQAVSAESSAREKADQLLQADVDAKMAPDDVVAGKNVSVSVGDDGKVTVSAVGLPGGGSEGQVLMWGADGPYWADVTPP